MRRDPAATRLRAAMREFYNDHIGTLSGPIATELIGGELTYTVAAQPDGTIQLSGSLSGGATDIEFGPNPIDAILPSLDADGFPDDVLFHDSMARFTQVSAQGTLSGLLPVRHLPPPSPAPPAAVTGEPRGAAVTTTCALSRSPRSASGSPTPR